MTECLKKLKSKAGESLIESLCAILIFTMASVVLFSLVSVSGDINRKAKAKDAENQAHLVAVEKGESDTRNGSATVTFTLEKGAQNVKIAEVDVDIYGGQNGSLHTYFVHVDPSAGSGG